MLAKGVLKFIVIPPIISLIFLLLYFLTFRFPFLTLFVVFISILIFLFLLFFFRDPRRTIGEAIVAPADGIVVSIEDFSPGKSGIIEPELPQKEYVKIAIFMNLHNVHVNRAPISGKIKELKHTKGRHLPAFFKDAERNEHEIMILETEIGKIAVVRIAGILARRIISYVNEAKSVEKGERIGIICLGSRVDVYLPKDKVKPVVSERERTKAGVTKIADIIQ